MPRDSVGQTFKVALILCVVCSVLVSAVAVTLRPRQQANELREMQKNILMVAGLYEESRHDVTDVEELFRKVDRRLVRLPALNGASSSTAYTPDPTEEEKQRLEKAFPGRYDPVKAAANPRWSDRVPGELDIADIKRREQYTNVYLVKDPEGRLDQVVLPVRGYGLWSTLYGFLAIDADTLRKSPEAIEIQGLTFYQHGETPGLGGEVDNPRWKAQWDGKKAFDGDWNVEIRVIKGQVDSDDPEREHKVDGLSGATITSRGVSRLVKFWLGDHGFRPFLKTLHSRLKHGDGGEDGEV